MRSVLRMCPNLVTSGAPTRACSLHELNRESKQRNVGAVLRSFISFLGCLIVFVRVELGMYIVLKESGYYLPMTLMQKVSLRVAYNNLYYVQQEW